MTIVRLLSWSPGLDKVRLTKSIRKEAGLPLDQAHDAVNRFLAGEVVELRVDSTQSAQELIDEASALGVAAEITDMKVVAQ